MPENKDLRKQIQELKRKQVQELDLGDIVDEMIRLAIQNPTVLNPIEIPPKTPPDYNRYHALKDELKQREKDYRSYKPAPRY